jgi:hypothetical protein
MATARNRASELRVFFFVLEGGWHRGHAGEIKKVKNRMTRELSILTVAKSNANNTVSC